jgi:drug/metabolite transporter (DMT)-like permease
MTPLVVALGVLAGACFALAAAVQHRAAHSEPEHHATDPRLLLRLLHRPLWLAGSLADGAGFAVQTLALRRGPLAVVQPVMVSGLLLSVPLEAALAGRRPHGRDLAAVVLGGAALAAFLLAATPGAGIAEPSAAAWAATAAWVAPLVVGCLALALRAHGQARATALGLATGIAYGLTAALLKAVAEGLSNPPALLADWRLYALAVVGVAGLALNQNAFQNGTLAGPLTALTLAEPVVALVISVTAYSERLSVGPGGGLVLAMSGAAMATALALAPATPNHPSLRESGTHRCVNAVLRRLGGGG